MNIYQKLIEVRKAVPYLKKDNSGYQFSYVSSSQTLGTVRAKMDEMGLLLVPRISSQNVSDHQTKKGDHEYFTEINVDFTWVNSENPEETVTCPWYGQGLDNGEKGVGKALTYAEKYFLLKFFNIATDKDDPDSFQKKHNGDFQPSNIFEQEAEWIGKADQNKDSLKTLEAWYKKNKAIIFKLPPQVQTKLNRYVGQLKEELTEKPQTITCPNGGQVTAEDCKEATCSSTYEKCAKEVAA